MTALTTPPRLDRRRLRAGAILALLLLVPLGVAGTLVAASSDLEDGLQRVPAIIVNDDEMVTQTTPDGEETQVLAGRLLVTELTSSDDETFSWSISDQDGAQAALDDGTAYVVLTVPEDFSESITSLQENHPEVAHLEIVADDSHSYLVGAATELLSDTLAATFGQEITEQVVNGLYTGLDQLGDGFRDAAEGATDLAAGAEQYAEGAEQYAEAVDELASGLAQLAAGLPQLSSGVRQYTDGVGELNAGFQPLSEGLAGYVDGVEQTAAGVAALDEAAQELDQLTAGVAEYTSGVAVLSEEYAQVLASIPPSGQLTAGQVAALGAVGDGLQQVAAGGDELLASTRSGIDQFQAGVAQLDAGVNGSVGGNPPLAEAGAPLAAGAAQLADGLAELAANGGELAAGVAEAATGADELAAGAEQLADGADELAAGAEELADGSDQLANGLQQAADEAPSYTNSEIDDAAAVVSEPVTASADREHAIEDAGQALLALFLPVGLWVGGLAAVLALGRPSRQRLLSPASTGRIVGSDVLRLAGLAGAQGLLVGGTLSVATGIPLVAAPGVVAISIVGAITFTLVNRFLTLWLGRAGVVVSLVLLTVQLVSAGGIFPIEIVAAPFQAISPLLPMSYAVDALQSTIAGGAAGPIVTGTVALALFGALAWVLSLAVTARQRDARLLGLVPARGMAVPVA